MSDWWNGASGSKEMKIILLALCVLVTNRVEAGHLTKIDFETYPDGTSVGNLGGVSTQWQSIGLLLSSCAGNSAQLYTGVCAAQHTVYSGIRAVGTICGGESLELSFVHPKTGKPGFVKSVGFWAEVAKEGYCYAPVTSVFYDLTGQPFQTNVASGNPPSYLTLANYYFVSATNRRGISKVKISNATYFLVDDVEFSSVSVIPRRYRL
jgi:hypothetical protein